MSQRYDKDDDGNEPFWVTYNKAQANGFLLFIIFAPIVGAIYGILWLLGVV